jgi:uncharacterized protein involved in exopolysaccharide biosynthesis
VARRLLRQVVDVSVRDRAELAESTSRFLDTELERTRTRLVEQERRVQEFRERYAGQLPGEVPANLQILQGRQTQLNDVMEELRQDRERRSQIQEYMSRARTDDAPQGPDVPPIPLPSDPAAKQLATARAAMTELLKKYTAEHPDVVQLNSRIAQLEKAQASAAAGATPQVTADQVPQMDRDAIARAELQRLDKRIQEREALERNLREGVATYQARIEAVPSRESEWVALTRDYQTLQASYASMLAKKEESNLSENLERLRVGEQFRIVAEPTAPTRPASPNRPAIVLIAVLVGIACGLIIPMLLELTDVKLRAENEVVTALRLPVLAMLPKVTTLAQLEQRQTRRMRLGVAALVIFAVAAAWRLR